MPSTAAHFADRLLAACEEKGAPVCVGLDPVYAKLPRTLRAEGVDPSQQARAAVDAIGQFCAGVIDAVADLVPAVKIQSACFERYLWVGVEALHGLIHHAKQAGLLVILDGKRGDIGISSEHYAAGCLREPRFTDLGAVTGPDALTVNGYLGVDGLDPFIAAAVQEDKGLFALVRTSNPGGDALQREALARGGSVAEQVARLIAQAGDHCVGTRGYSALGAVVGATKGAEAAALRRLMPRQIFLVPGFGAQGGGADDVRACFHEDGTGAIITASRSVLYPFDAEDAGADWRGAVRAAAVQLRDEVAGVLGRG
jgi:orotidine-5'-phosphate decarboxylase